MTYSPSTEECVFSACVAHPGGLVQQALQELLDTSIINIIILRHWVTAVRWESSSEKVDIFIKNLLEWQTHDVAHLQLIFIQVTNTE